MIADWLPQLLPRLVARIPATVHTKLLAAFLTILVLLVTVGAVGLHVLGEANRRAGERVRLQRKIAAYRQLQHDTTRQLYSVASALRTPSERTFEATLRQLNQFGYDFDRLQFVAKDEAELLARVRENYDRFVKVVTNVVDLTRRGADADERERQLTQATPLADRLERLTNELVDRAEAEMLASTEASHRAYVASRWVIIGVALGSIGLALLLGYAISWSLIGPVKQMDAWLRQIASGNFSQRVEIPNRDEMGGLASNLNRMSEELGRLYRQLEVQRAALIRVSQVMSATLDPQRIVQAILQSVGALMEGVLVMLWELRDSGGLYPTGSSRSETEGLAIAIPLGEGLVGRVAASRTPLAVEDLRHDPRVIRPELIAKGGWVSFLGLPLVREERLLGVLSILTRTPHRFIQDEIDFFASFAHQASTALENARLYQDLQRSHQELLAAQDELVRKARMAAIGEIAAAVAHETRNPLGALSNSVQLLRKNPHITGEDAELLEVIETESKRLNEIVSDFLAFGRPRPPHFQVVDVHGLIDEIIGLLQRDDRCSPSIAFVRVFDPALPKPRADRHQLRQVFWNLLLNAVQAIGERGALRVETRSLRGRVEILVRDTGPGIPASLLPKIFEPLYSTKASGSGLGLPIVRRIVEEHRGRITVDSHEGGGTCFALSLPLDPEANRGEQSLLAEPGEGRTDGV